MRTKLKDIAQDTGLSVTTVSLVLNGRGASIPPATQQRVMEAAKRLNYRPNQLAIGLVKRQTKTIGLLVADIRNSYYAAIAKGVEDACRLAGWNVMLCNTDNKHSREMEYLHVLSSKGVDGIIVSMVSDINEKKYKETQQLLKDLAIPYLLLDRESPFGQVMTDHYVGGYLAMTHLLELGHRRLGCITGPMYMQGARHRMEGVYKALEAYDIPPEDLVVYEGSYSYDSGEEAMRHLAPMGLTGIFAFNDMMAYGVYHVCKEMGIAVPEQLSLIGYDNIYFSDLMEVPLTTIQLPNEKVGLEMGKLLISAITGAADDTIQKEFVPQLLVRASTAPIQE